MEFSCGGCDATWTGVNTSHCGVGGCHQTFAGPSLFDKHRQATTKARVWVKYLDSEGPLGVDGSGKVMERFVHPKNGRIHESERKTAARVYAQRMAVNRANGADVWGVETRDVQLPRGRCVDPATLTRPLSDVEIELGAVGQRMERDGFVWWSVPVLEFYGTSYEAMGRDGKMGVRTRAEMWRSYRLRDVNGDIIEREAWRS